MLSFNGYRLDYRRAGAFVGRSLSNEDVPASASYYRLTKGRELQLEIAWVTWANEERGVRLAALAHGPERLGRLLRGGRVGVYEGAEYGLPSSTEWCELRVMRERPHQLPTPINVPYADLVRAAGGEDVWGMLNLLGASAIGPRRHLLRESNRRGTTLITTFPAGNSDVPVAAWVMTKVLPIVNRFRG